MNDVPGSGQPLRQPPGHPPHGHASAAQLPQPQGAGPRLIPTRALAIVTCVAVALVMAAYAVRGLLAPIVADKLDLMLASHSPVTLTPLHVFDWVNSWSGQLLLIAAVLTIIWLNLVRRNTEALSPKAFHERSAVWVTLGWVVPIVNLWFPFQVVRDIQHGLHPNPSVRRAPAVAGHLAGYWWFLSLAAFFAPVDRAPGVRLRVDGQRGPRRCNPIHGANGGRRSPRAQGSSGS